MYEMISDMNCSVIEKLVKENISGNTLYLNNKNIDSAQFNSIIEYMNSFPGMCKNIETIDLSHNKITETEITKFLDATETIEAFSFQ